VIGSSQIVLGVGFAILHVVFHAILHRRECGVNLLVLGVVGDALPLSKLGGASEIACQTFTQLLAREQITIDHCQWHMALSTYIITIVCGQTGWEREKFGRIWREISVIRGLRHTSIATLLKGASKSLLARLDLETFAAVSTSVHRREPGSGAYTVSPCAGLVCEAGLRVEQISKGSGLNGSLDIVMGGGRHSDPFDRGGPFLSLRGSGRGLDVLGAVVGAFLQVYRETENQTRKECVRFTRKI